MAISLSNYCTATVLLLLLLLPSIRAAEPAAISKFTTPTMSITITTTTRAAEPMAILKSGRWGSGKPGAGVSWHVHLRSSGLLFSGDEGHWLSGLGVQGECQARLKVSLGFSLQQLLTSKNPLPPPSQIFWGLQSAAGLSIDQAAQTSAPCSVDTQFKF